MMKNDKTNVMRLLDEWGIEYEAFYYNSELVNAVEVAKACGREPESVFKTLVTVGKTGEHYVFMVPSNGELDLIIFLRDPLTAQPHEPDVSALLRLCDVQSIPLATNVSSAIIMLEAIKNKIYFN